VFEVKIAKGILFIGEENDKKKVASSTWWILQTTHKRVGVTVLHSVEDFMSPRFFILRDETHRKFDTFPEFIQHWNQQQLEFYFEVKPILLQERLDWIKSKEKTREFGELIVLFIPSNTS